MRQELGDRLPMPRDSINITQRGTFQDHHRCIDGLKNVADGLEEWFLTRACDGFVIAASHVPGAWGLLRLVVREIQRRGLFHVTINAGRRGSIWCSTVLVKTGG